jgi:hypothetical protein
LKERVGDGGNLDYNIIPMLRVVSRPGGEQIVKNTQTQCKNIKQSGVNDRTNK